jgi:hypothetical protein
MPNVEVTGTLRQGTARCTISNGAVRPLAATCPSRPFCYIAPGEFWWSLASSRGAAFRIGIGESHLRSSRAAPSSSSRRDTMRFLTPRKSRHSLNLAQSDRRPSTARRPTTTSKMVWSNGHLRSLRHRVVMALARKQPQTVRADITSELTGERRRGPERSESPPPGVRVERPVRQHRRDSHAEWRKSCFILPKYSGLLAPAHSGSPHFSM